MNDAQVLEIIKRSQKAFKRADKIAKEKREIEEEIRGLCREYSEACSVWGWQPHMLRKEVNSRMGKKAA
jgi:nucleoside-diphosphate-sugar epimerase